MAGAFIPIPKNVGFGIKTTTFDPGWKPGIKMLVLILHKTYVEKKVFPPDSEALVVFPPPTVSSTTHTIVVIITIITPFANYFYIK
jgi:hypothetical protein